MEKHSVVDAFRLDGRLALITGGSRGIGFGIARAMQDAGAKVILVARAGGSLERAAESLGCAGVPFDMREYESVGPWYERLVAEHGAPDVLVNSAGITLRSPAEETPMAAWQEVINVNLSAVFAMSQAFARPLIAAGRSGKIVNLASLTTWAARRTVAAYTASKGGIGQLTKALAVDWAAKNIRVNAIAPGYIATEMNAPLLADESFSSWVKQRTPLGRWGEAADIALPAVFLASAASDFITGQTIFVDGGWTATF